MLKYYHLLNCWHNWSSYIELNLHHQINSTFSQSQVFIKHYYTTHSKSHGFHDLYCKTSFELSDAYIHLVTGNKHKLVPLFIYKVLQIEGLSAGSQKMVFLTYTLAKSPQWQHIGIPKACSHTVRMVCTLPESERLGKRKKKFYANMIFQKWDRLGGKNRRVGV